MKQKGGNGIGVVVAAYNAAAWLVRCLDSVLAAADVDAADVCIVVADDGSTDGTAAIAALPAQVDRVMIVDAAMTQFRSSRCRRWPHAFRLK